MRSRVASRLSRLARCSSITRCASGSSAREVPAAVVTEAKSAECSLGLTQAFGLGTLDRGMRKGPQSPLVGDAAQRSSPKVRLGGNF